MSSDFKFRIADWGFRIGNCELRILSMLRSYSAQDTSDVPYTKFEIRNSKSQILIRTSPDELVPTAVYGQNEPRFLRIHFQFLSQVDDVGVNSTRVRVVIVSPHRIQQAIARERLGWMGEEICQQRKFLRGKFDRIAGAQYLITAKVDLNIAELINLGQWCQRRSASQHRFHTCHEFANGERLSDIIIGAQLQAHHLVDFLAARRQHDDRN